MSRSPVRIAACLALAIGTAVMNPRIVHAQDVMDARSAVYLRDQYIVDLDTLHAKIVALAIAIPDDKYSYEEERRAGLAHEVVVAWPRAGGVGGCREAHRELQAVGGSPSPRPPSACSATCTSIWATSARMRALPV